MMGMEGGQEKTHMNCCCTLSEMDGIYLGVMIQVQKTIWADSYEQVKAFQKLLRKS